MNPSFIYKLTDEQKKFYYIQPDNIPFFELRMHDEYELSQSIRGTSLRFWFNEQPTDYSLHWHTTVEMITVLEGTYTVIVNNIHYELEPGDICIIPSGVLHSIKSCPQGCRFVYLFEMDTFSGFSSIQNIRALLNLPIVIKESTHEEFYKTALSLVFEAAEEYWKQESSYRELSVFSVLLKFLAEYGNYRIKKMDALNRPANTPPDLAFRLNRVYQYIDEHLSENIQLEDAANVANYSLYHFSRIFKESTGQTFSEYLRHVRIKAAQQLLQQMDTQIIWIAHECGFSSLSTFNRTFRSVTGSTPSEYRSLWTLQKDIL